MDTVVNLVHLLATAVWLGGAITMKLVFEPAAKAIDPREGGKFMGLVASRFSVVAWTCVGLLLVTGIMKTPAEMYFAASSDVEIALTVKHILFLVMIGVGLVITLVIVPRMRQNAPAPGEPPSATFLAAQKRVGLLSMINTLLGLGVLLCASLLW